MHFRSGGLRLIDEIFERAGVAVQHRRNNGVNAPVNDLIIRKANVRLVRVNVHVHDFGRNVKKQNVKRILPLHEIACVRVGDRRAYRLIDDVTPVDEQALPRAVRFEKVAVS